MPQVVRLGDPSSHGGNMVTATAHFKTNKIVTCVDGDLHSCPIPGHGTTSVTGTASPKSTGKYVIKTGDVAGCGAVITDGSPDTFTS